LRALRELEGDKEAGSPEASYPENACGFCVVPDDENGDDDEGGEDDEPKEDREESYC